MEAIQILLIQIAVILLLSRILGAAMKYINQPQVVGEMIAGIMLGPSVLGLLHGGQWMHELFPGPLRENLNVLSQLGVMVFMFLVGLELDPKLLRGQGKAAFVTGIVGIVVPFIGGALLALLLTATQPAVIAVTGVVPSSMLLCMFIGTAMSITAFPVLARILTERNLHRTRSGALALTCAAMNDVMGWCILAFVLAVAHMKGFGNEAANHSHAVMSAIKTVLFAVTYVALMVLVVRRLLGRLQAHFNARGYLSQNVMAVIFLLLIGSSIATDIIGIHQIFGAFMLGAVMPKESNFIKHLSEKVEDFAVLFLLPLFFAYTGLNTQLGLLSGHLWLICALIVCIAIAGKFGGVTLAARWYGMNWRQSSLLGILMNTRGLMELIILNIGLMFGVLSPSLFSMMVVMALVTTFMTTPLMRLVYSPQRQRKELEESAGDEADKASGVHVVVPVSLKSSAPALVRMGAMLIGPDAGRLYALHLDRPEEAERRPLSPEEDVDEVLDVAHSAAEAAHVPIQTVSFVSRNIGGDIASAARRYHASWVVMGWHKPVFFSSILGPTVAEVIRKAPANVAIFVDKGLTQLTRIIVPYLGEAQDRGALVAAERLSRLPGVRVTILHVIKNQRTDEDPHLGIQTLLDKQFAHSTKGGLRMQVIETQSPIEVVVEESRKHDLMILGLTDTWNLKNTSMFGKHESVAQRTHCSLLIVHASPEAPVIRSEPAALPMTAVENKASTVSTG